MKLNLTKSLNLQTTVGNTYTSFHFSNPLNSPELDNFYKNATDSSGKGMTHIINYDCLLPYGSDDSYSSSESLCYCLNFYSELYMISKKNNQADIFNDCIDNIFYILNTIILLFKNIPASDSGGNSTDYIKEVIFPMWNFYDNGATITNYPYKEYSTSNATDSNIELLKSLLKLYIFNANDTLTGGFYNHYLDKIESIYLKQQTFFLGVSINSTDVLSTVLKKMIVLMIYNLMDGLINTDDTVSTGSFATNYNVYPYTYSYGSTIVGNGYGNVGSNNIMSNKFFDYINFGCFIYIYEFFNLVGINPTNPENSTISSIIPGASSNHFPSWANTKTVLTTYITYINSNITSTTFITDNLIGTDNLHATLSRLSYQIINLYILLNKGDVRLNISKDVCSATWTFISPTTKDMISNICSNLINFQIHNDFLYLEQKDSDPIVFPGVIINSNPYSSYPSNPEGFYRQLSYMCFKQLSGISFNASRTDGNYIYFENNDFGYFGFTSVNGSNSKKVVPNSLQKMFDSYTYKNLSNFYISGFGDTTDSGSDWKQNGTSWSGANNSYFNFSLCSLHQMNFYLYIGF